MKNPNATPKPKTPAELSCTELLAALVQYEQKHTTENDLMSIEMFSDGSGHLETLKMGDMFEFTNLHELLAKLKAANNAISQPSANKPL